MTDEEKAEEYADWFWGASPSEQRAIKQAYLAGLVETRKENEYLKKQIENRNCSNCRQSKTGCPNDGSCHNFSLWQPFINPELTKAMNEAKGIIKDLLHCLPKENIEGVYEVTEAAEQFINKLENGGMTDTKETNEFDEIKYLRNLLNINQEMVEEYSKRIREQQKTIGNLTDTIDEMKAQIGEHTVRDRQIN